MQNLTIRSTEPARDPVLERALTDTGPIACNEALVPAPYCRAVLAEPVPPPCGLKTGTSLAEMLFRCYPGRDAADPKTYALALASVFADYPEPVGRAAIHALIRRLKWLPTAADINEACTGIAGVETQRRNRARRILVEHDRRRAEAEHDAEIERDRPIVLARLREIGGLAAMLRPAPDEDFSTDPDAYF
jgi:hypothetical protein